MKRVKCFMKFDEVCCLKYENLFWKVFDWKVIQNNIRHVLFLSLLSAVVLARCKGRDSLVSLCDFSVATYWRKVVPRASHLKNVGMTNWLFFKIFLTCLFIQILLSKWNWTSPNFYLITLYRGKHFNRFTIILCSRGS